MGDEIRQRITEVLATDVEVFEGDVAKLGKGKGKKAKRKEVKSKPKVVTVNKQQEKLEARREVKAMTAAKLERCVYARVQVCTGARVHVCTCACMCM